MAHLLSSMSVKGFRNSISIWWLYEFTNLCSLLFLLMASYGFVQRVTYTVSGKKRPEYSKHNFDKFRHRFVIFGKNHPDTSVY